MAGQSEFEQLSTALQKSLLASSRLAGQIPAAGELRYQRTLSRPLGKKVDEASRRLLHISSRVLEIAKQASSSKDKGKKVLKESAELEEEDLIDGYQRRIVDVTDQLLEQIDINLDEHYNGTAKGKAKAAVAEAPVASTSGQTNGRSGYSNFRNAGDIRKPQLDFAKPLDSGRMATFVPTLPSKPHALVPLDLEATSYDDPDTGKCRTRIANPYTTEIQAVLEKPLPDLDNPYATLDTERMESQMATKPFTYVDSTEKLIECLGILKQATVIAIDLEHHDQRTFRGVTCLMQVSTIAHDFIIDPLVPAVRAELHILNEVFANPDIVKVLHGADWDIIWLQRDFGIYIVNLFDTYQASRELGRLTGHSLASLLQEYTTFSPEKKYQLADWRIRPLTPALITYARSDTHFLIYIFFAILHHTSMTPGMLQSIRVKSARTASQTYEYSIYDYDEGYGTSGWRKLLERSGKLYIWGVEPYATSIDQPVTESKPWQWVDKQGKMKFEVYRGLHDWRDRKARELDESTGYLLSNKALLAIAEALPTDLLALQTALGKEVAKLDASTRTAILNQVTSAVSRALAATSEPQIPSARSADASVPPVKTPAPALLFSTGSTEESKASRPSSFISRMSSFFGNTAASDTNKSGLETKEFAQAVQKVHQDLLGQLQPMSADAAGTFNNVKQEPMDARELSPEASTSSQKPAKVEDSEIVSVTGRSKGNQGKKRKEFPSQSTAGTVSEHSTSKSSKGKLPFVKPFDYTGVKSVLDSPAQVEAEAPKKRPKKTKGGDDGEAVEATGPSFKRAPKPMNQPKHGNKSHTFL